MHKYFGYIAQKSKLLGLFLLGLVMVVGSVHFVRQALEKAADFHWSIGLLVAGGTLGGLFFLLRWIETAPYTPDNFGHHPRLGLMLHLILVVLTAIIAMSFISAILFQQGLVSYSSSNPVSTSRLLDFYGWHFIDSIPVVDIWRIFGIENARITAVDVEARVLLEVFRILIVATVIRTFLKKKGQFWNLLLLAKNYRYDGKYEKAELIMKTVMRIAENTNNPVWQADANIEYAKIYSKQAPEKVATYLDAASILIGLAEDAADLERRKIDVRSMRNFLEG